MFVCASNQSGSCWALPQSEWFLQWLCSSWVVPLGEQFVCIVLEFTEYYKENCMHPGGTVSRYSNRTLPLRHTDSTCGDGSGTGTGALSNYLNIHCRCGWESGVLTCFILNPTRRNLIHPFLLPNRFVMTIRIRWPKQPFSTLYTTWSPTQW